MTNMIRKCTPAEARAAFLAENGCQIVDVREFSEYDAERVDGATLASLSALDQNLGLIERDRPVYLMCSSGAPGRGLAVAIQSKLAALRYLARIEFLGDLTWAVVGLVVAVWLGRKLLRYLSH